MNIDTGQVRQCLKAFDFRRLFIQELNWSHCTNRPIDLEIDGDIARITPLAELGGVVVYQVEMLNCGEIPSTMIRRQIENKIKQMTHEHIIIFADANKTKSVWQWVRRGGGYQTATREHTYYRNQPGDSLLVKLDGIAFDISERDSDGNVKVMKVVERLKKAFDVEKVTKRFYDEFKAEHTAFCKFLKGLEVPGELAWYASVMLNRLMFIYFIQKKGFLNGDTNYLANKLKESKQHGADQFYKNFLTRLFFEGFAREEKERSTEVNRLLGKVPYLNGGLFLPHQLEVTHGEKINISDHAFERLFDFFDRYSWHLDYRPLKADNEINPDVLGYIFEKYINQKQMGAYYTKEDITDYICKNTIIPFLFDKLENMRYEELHPFPMKDVEPYIYDAVKQKEYLPTETEREYQARQKRYQQIKDDFAAGKIASINDLITYNLDIRKFAEDWVASIKDQFTLRAFYFHCLTKVTVLDPAAGSGAFLFAALNMLEPLYEICLDKMEELGEPKYPDFAEELKRISQHPNRPYFILKSIIVNNLFGVDIMEEAVEICKLRLFLKLVAQVDDVNKIEPLPDIDFNIRAGNSLVGYTNLEQIKAVSKGEVAQGKMDLGGEIERIDRSAQAVDRAFQSFRALQTQIGIDSHELAQAKAGLKADLGKLQDELNRYLAGEYGIDVKNPATYERWLSTHQPFHWFVEFYGIMKEGGFDTIIGNPPYVEYTKVKDIYTVREYKTESCANLYPFFIERSLILLSNRGKFGMIVPISAFSNRSMGALQDMLKVDGRLFISSFHQRPAQLFNGVLQRLSICIVHRDTDHKNEILTTSVMRWYTKARDTLFHNLQYVAADQRFQQHMVKLGNNIEKSIYSKFMIQGELKRYLSTNSTMNDRNFVSYRTAGGGYWWTFLNSEFETESLSNKVARFKDNYDARVFMAALNSNLFWWFYFTNYDLFNLKDYMVFSFRFDYPQSKEIRDSLVDLSKRLEEELLNNARRYLIRSRTRGDNYTLTYQKQKSKLTMDDIDRVLAKHYGFTEEELDFIINYDIKYRMGQDNEEQDIEER